MPAKETPTAPPSPAIQAPARPPLAVRERSIRADQSKCAICYRWLDLQSGAKAIEHFNQCWDVLRTKAKNAKGESNKNLESPEVEENDQTTTEITQDTDIPPEDNELSNTVPLHSTDLPTTSCLLCNADLRNLKALDAFHHRVTCLRVISPSCCPVCEQSFTELPEPPTESNEVDITNWDVYDMIWHIHACQNDCHWSDVAQNAYVSLISRYADRIEVAETIITKWFGDRKARTAQQHRANVSAKKELGLRRQDGIYRTECSPLRTSQTILPARKPYSGTEIEITRVEKEVVADMIPFDFFKLSSYSVLKLAQKSTLAKDYKAKKVTTEIESPFDSRSFWSKFLHLHHGEKKTSTYPVTDNAAAAVSITRNESIVDDSNSVDLPVTSDRLDERSRPRLLHHNREMGNLTTPRAAVDELEGDRQKLLASSKDPTEDTKPLKLDVTAKGILLPQSVPSSPAIIHTYSQEGVLTLPRSVHKFPDIIFTCSHDEPDNPLASISSSAPKQTTRTCTLIQPPRKTTASPTTTMRVSPVRLPKGTTVDSPSVIMPRRNSLEDTQPYIFPAPYAHTVFFADDSFLTFGEGVVPPPPGSVRYTDTIEREAVGQEEPVSSVNDGPQREPENDTTVSAGSESMVAGKTASSMYDSHSPGLIRNQVSMDSIHPINQSWADEMDAQDDLHSSLPPASANIPVTPSPEPSSGVRNETTRHPAPPLRPEMFLNPDEVDQETSYETYAYGLRGDISVTLRSNIQTIIGPALSQAEQKMRNRERCRGMFGSLAETTDNT